MKYISERLIRLFTTVAAFTLLAALPLRAQTPVEPEVRHALVDSITSPWADWQEVPLSGQLKMAGLPVSPSVKLYMQRDSSIFLSLRAPFVGEVGRAEITDSTVLVVNKMNKVYVEESLEKLLSFYPGTISDLQNIFLGRVALPGLGMLSHDVEESIDIFSEADTSFTLVPDVEVSIPGVNYGYVFDSAFLPVALLVLPESAPDISVTLTYDYFEKGYDLTVIYRSDKKNIQGVLEFDEPDFEGRPFDRIKLNSKYRKVDLKDFLKSSDI